MAAIMSQLPALIFNKATVTACCVILSLAQTSAFADSLYGLANSHGQISVPPQYGGWIEFEAPNKYKALTKIGAAPITINAAGEDISNQSHPIPVLPTGATEHEWITDNVLRFRVGNNVGACDPNGNIVIPAEYSGLFSIGPGLLAARDDEDYHLPYKLYDLHGNFINRLPVNILPSPQYSEGFLKVGQSGSPITYYDTQGKKAISGPFTSGEPFHQGLSAVTLTYRTGHGAGYIDHSGKLVIGPFKNATVTDFDRDYGIVTFYVSDFEGVSIPSAGVTDRNGKLVIPAIYDQLWRFNKSLFFAKLKGDFSLVDLNARTVAIFPSNCIDAWATNSDAEDKLIPCAFLESIKETAPYEKPVKDTRWGYCDLHGAIVIKPQYERACSFEDGLAIVQVKTGEGLREGLINKDGTFQLAPIYLDVTRFPDGTYCLCQTDGSKTEPTKADLIAQRPDNAFPRMLREHDLIGMSKDEVTKYMGAAKTSNDARPDIPESVTSTIQYELSRHGMSHSNAVKAIEIGFYKSNKAYGWRTLSFQTEGEWWVENVTFPNNWSDFALTSAIPKPHQN